MQTIRSNWHHTNGRFSLFLFSPLAGSALVTGAVVFLLGLVVSGASKSGGALLVFCLLVVVPATELLLARR